MAIEGRKQHVRKDRAERKAELLDAGVKAAKRYGVKNVTRVMIANAAKVTDGLVSAYFGSLKKLHDTLTREAAKRGIALPTPEQTERMRLKLWHEVHPNAGQAPAPKAKPKHSKKIEAAAQADKKKKATPAKKSATATQRKPSASRSELPKPKPAVKAKAKAPAKKSAAAKVAAKPKPSASAKPAAAKKVKAPALPPLPPLPAPVEASAQA